MLAQHEKFLFQKLSEIVSMEDRLRDHVKYHGLKVDIKDEIQSGDTLYVTYKIEGGYIVAKIVDDQVQDYMLVKDEENVLEALMSL